MDFSSDTRIARLRQCIEGATRITVVSHAHPDGDALGSTTAMACFLSTCLQKDVVALYPDTPADNLRFILRGEIPVLSYDASPQKCRERIARTDLLILLDANTLSRTEALEPFLKASPAQRVMIDHHVGPDTEAFPLIFSTTEISSASELLYWVLKALWSRPLPLPCLEALLTGMTTDTNNFANSVFPSTLTMASEILSAGVDRDAILQQIYNQYRENRVRLFGYMESSALTLLPCGAAYMVLSKEIKQRFNLREGESEGLVNVPLSIREVRLSLLLKEEEGFFRLSIRSKKGTSARLLAQQYFHGGGHENASGGKLFFPADIPSPEAAPAYVEQILKEYLS